MSIEKFEGPVSQEIVDERPQNPEDLIKYWERYGIVAVALKHGIMCHRQYWGMGLAMIFREGKNEGDLALAFVKGVRLRKGAGSLMPIKEELERVVKLIPVIDAKLANRELP